MEHCCEGCEKHCTLAIYFSLKSHFLLHCFMVIACKSPSYGMYMCMYVQVHICMHIRIYQVVTWSEKWLFVAKFIGCCCIGIVERDSHFNKDSSDFTEYPYRASLSVHCSWPSSLDGYSDRPPTFQRLIRNATRTLQPTKRRARRSRCIPPYLRRSTTNRWQRSIL